MKYTADRQEGGWKGGRKLKPLQALLLFYQKVEDKLVEYRKMEEEKTKNVEKVVKKRKKRKTN